MKFLSLSIFLIFIYLVTANAQELNCRVQVNANNIQGTNRDVFQEMQKTIFEYMNNHKWTNNVFGPEERIECNFNFTISERLSADEFKGQLQITSSRPAYNTGYNSSILNLIDTKVQFRYAEGEPLIFNETSYTSELMALLGYYAYMVIGLDYDTFSPKGGSEYFSKAEQIVQYCQGSQYSGWKSFEDRNNRYWLVENLQNSVYAPVRTFYYQFHRQGIDLMSTKPMEARTNIVEALKTLLNIHRQKPGSMIMQVLFDAKSQELINVFSEGEPNEKRSAYNYLKEMNASNASKYEKIIK